MTYLLGVPPNDVERFGFVTSVREQNPDVKRLAEIIVESPSFTARELSRSQQ